MAGIPTMSDDSFTAGSAVKPRVLFVANPNNPTGTLLSHADLQKIVRASIETAIVIDEAYAEFSGLTVLPWIQKYPHLFVTRTFSKAAGLAGLRLGAVLAAKSSLAMLRRAMPPYPVNVAALAAAEAAIRDVRALRNYVQDIKRVREWFEKELLHLGAAIYPSSANFLLADFGPRGPALFKQLAARGILVRERKDFRPGFARITIGTEPEMRRFVKETKSIWRASIQA